MGKFVCITGVSGSGKSSLMNDILARALLKKLVQKAREFSYKTIYLDTGPFMTSAQHLYRSFGFVEREEYPETEVPEQIRSKWLFMEKILSATRQ